MTSSFKRPQDVCLPLHFDSLSSRRRLLTGLCTPLVASNLSSAAIFYPASSASMLLETLMLDLIRHPFPGCSGWILNWGPTYLFLFLPLKLGSHWYCWSLEKFCDVNSSWWHFPFSFVVTWLCQSGSLMSGEYEPLAAREPHFYNHSLSQTKNYIKMYRVIAAGWQVPSDAPWSSRRIGAGFSEILPFGGTNVFLIETVTLQLPAPSEQDS